MSDIYLAMACWTYEGASPIKAFTDLAAANAFVARCSAYHESSEPCPDDDDGFDAWQERHEAWEAAHPGGTEYAICDSFAVWATELVTASETDEQA